MFDFSPGTVLVLAVLALILFGPNELPRIAQQAGRALRDLRRIAEGARADLQQGLGPEFRDFDFEDLDPRRFVRKHLLDDLDGADGLNGAPEPNGARDLNGTAHPMAGGPAGDGAAPSLLLDGGEPPFDVEAT